MSEQSRSRTQVPPVGPTPTGEEFLEAPYEGQSLLDEADEHVRERDVFGRLDPEDAATVSERTRKKLGIAFWIAAGWMIVLIVLAVIAPVITDPSPIGLDLLPDPNEGVTSDPTVEENMPIGTAGHPLGTDALGRDLLSRTIWGARVSLTVGFAAVALGLFLGSLIGLVAGYYRGKIESSFMAAMDVMLAFPALVLALAIITFTGQRNMWVITIAIGIVSVPPLARLVRANTLTYSQREFVLAARTVGAKSRRIIWREIVPNVARAALTFALIAVAVSIVAEGFLAFLGLSIPPPDPSWGKMINEGRSDLTDAPWVTMVPATALFLTVMAINFAGDRLRAYFDVKEAAL